jgi:hypothetical protein
MGIRVGLFEKIKMKTPKCIDAEAQRTQRKSKRE